MYPFGLVNARHLAVGYAYLIYITLQRTLFRCRKDDFLLLGVEAQYLLHKPVARSELLPSCLIGGSLQLLEVHQPEVVVAVALALVDEEVAVPRQEADGVRRLHILGVTLLVEYILQFTRSRIILAELGVVLVAVQLDEEEALLIRAPGDVGKVAVGGVTRLQIERLLRGGVVDTHLHLVARHAGHGVADGVHLAHAGRDIDQRILRHHAFVHAVEGQQRTLGAPEGTFRDTELIAVYTLSAHYTLRLIGHTTPVDIEVIAHGIGQVVAVGLVVEVGSRLLGEVIAAFYLACAPVVEGILLCPWQQGDELLCPGCADVAEVLHGLEASLFQRFVHLLQGEEQVLLTRLRVDGHDLLLLGTYAEVAPPLQAIDVLGKAVSLASRNQIFQGRLGFVLCHSIGVE